MKNGSNKSKPKLTFYPMAGSIGEQFQNIVEALRWIEKTKPSPHSVYEWLRGTFSLSHYFARDVYTVILVSSGLLYIRNGYCRLTPDALTFLSTGSPILLLEIFEKRFAGVAAFLEILRNKNGISAEQLRSTWFETVKERFPRMTDWSKRTLHNQCGHRVNWLRAMGLISAVNGRYSLSDLGWHFVFANPPESIGIQRHEVQKEEKNLRRLALRDFMAFDTTTEKSYTLRRMFARDRAFRKVVTAQYEHTCAVCELRLASPSGIFEAEAAHIVPKRKMGSDDPRNGLSLCGTHHWAFDEGPISVEPTKRTVRVAGYLVIGPSDESVKSVLKLTGQRIRPVIDDEFAPSGEALEWHMKNVFLG